MPKRIYVGNLPSSAGEREIRRLFEPFGRVGSIQLSRGSAVIEMASDGDAARAISGLNGRRMGTKSLNVNEARR